MESLVVSLFLLFVANSAALAVDRRRGPERHDSAIIVFSPVFFCCFAILGGIAGILFGLFSATTSSIFVTVVFSAMLYATSGLVVHKCAITGKVGYIGLYVAIFSLFFLAALAITVFFTFFLWVAILSAVIALGLLLKRRKTYAVMAFC